MALRRLFQNKFREKLVCIKGAIICNTMNEIS